jgi:hypothetical protein
MQFLFEVPDGFAPANAEPGDFLSINVDPESLEITIAVGHEWTGQSANDLLLLIGDVVGQKLVPIGETRLAVPQMRALLQSFCAQQRAPDRAVAGSGRLRLSVF